jgi:hypothetical protein
VKEVDSMRRISLNAKPLNRPEREAIPWLYRFGFK